LLLDPLDFPDDVAMLVLHFFTRGDGDVLSSGHALLNVIDRDVSMGVSDSNVVLLLLGVSTTGDTVVSLDVQLREIRFLQRVETEEARLELVVVNAVNVVLSVTHSHQVLIG